MLRNYIILSVFWVVGFTFLPVQSALAQPTAYRGVIDLRDYHFDRDDPVELTGDWQFYWQQLLNPGEDPSKRPELVTMPHLWNEDARYDHFGFGTYQLSILLPKDSPPLALTIPDMYTAYKLFFNGELIASNGIVGSDEESSTPRWEPLTIPLDNTDDRSVEILLQISNFDHSKGGIRLPIIIGRQDRLLHDREIELGYDFLLTGMLLIGGFYFLALYYFGRSETAILTFALFCITYSYRAIGTELYPLHFILPDIPWLVTAKLEYISLFMSAALFGKFIHQLYPNETHHFVINPFNYVLYAFSIGTLLLPAYYFTVFIIFFFGMLGAYILYASWVFIQAWLHHRVGSQYSLIGVLVIFIVFIYDLLEYFVLIDENLFFTFVGYMAFFVMQSLTLTNRFSYTLEKAKETAEAASVAKTHFLSTMGHELRTPLNAVIGFSELLLDSKSDEEKKQFATTIKKSGENLLGIINNILDFTKIESEDLVLDKKPTHVPNLLADTVRMLGSLTDSKKVQLSFRYDDGLSQFIEADPARLRQILINLIGNAIKFTDEGEISVQVTSTSSIAEKGQILFIIKDTGIGIPDDKLDLLFDRFSQLDGDRSRKYGGTGLGLAITKLLIEGMGGRIWVQSEVGKGTTFYFTIKANFIDSVAEPEVNNDLELDSIRTNLNILIVEDNKINQTVAVKVLERFGFAADVAENGIEAIELVKQHPYDLILMDMNMPGMDGLEATGHINNMTDLDPKPVIIAMTANATLEDKADCFNAGMVDFIPKPITLASMRAALIKWF
ncbi:MAG TPA: hypothetical protein DEQ34_07840 [Balneolaceae bacterium]|nr:hypothetical protein [Balneolaceae bacterium]